MSSKKCPRCEKPLDDCKCHKPIMEYDSHSGEEYLFGGESP